MDDGHAQVRAWRGAATAAGLLAIVVLASSVAAQSPAPSSPSAADCVPVAAVLPPRIDDLVLVSNIVPGVAAIEPEELLDPLLGSLGRARSDVCVVVLAYGSGSAAVSGQLLHIQGASVPDLAARFSDAVQERLVAYGAGAVSTVSEVDGRPVWSLVVTAQGQVSQVLAWQMGDTLLVTSDSSAMSRLVPLLDVTVGPSPSSDPASLPPGVAPAPSG